MAVRGRNHELKGTVSNRVQVQNPITNKWVKIDTKRGRIVSQKSTPGPYKSVRKKK